MSGSLLLDQAIDLAWRFLARQAEAGFPDARHEMTFPRAAGFSGPERQASDLFTRAVIAGLLLDVADLDVTGTRDRECRRIAEREADRVALGKSRTRRGGWSYFPELPELPPDLDSLSAALALFARCRRQHLALCDEPLRIALTGLAPHASLETWIVSADDAPSDIERMQWGVARCWGSGTDPDVLANFCYALLIADVDAHTASTHRGARSLASLQQDAGCWTATWYAGPYYGTALAIQLLHVLNAEPDALARARAWLASAQRSDGGWGTPLALPIDTAISIWALQVGAHTTGPHVLAGCEWLLGSQNPDGSWFPSPWIQMPIGRPGGAIVRVATWESATVSTAFCLRSLCRVRRVLA